METYTCTFTDNKTDKCLCTVILETDNIHTINMHAKLLAYSKYKFRYNKELHKLTYVKI